MYKLEKKSLNVSLFMSNELLEAKPEHTQIMRKTFHKVQLIMYREM